MLWHWCTYIWIIQLSTQIHFLSCESLWHHYNLIKGLRNISYNENKLLKKFTYKKTIIMNNLFLQNIQFVTLNDTQIFNSTLCFDNVDDYNVI
jgi:hypothetical protein